jgi:hypothetical protein
MGCLMFFMLGGLSVAMGIYMGTLVSYFMAFVTLMAGDIWLFKRAVL